VSLDYLAMLSPGGEFDFLREAARLNYGKPQPHRAVPQSSYNLPGQLRETNSCPCPECYEIRLATWDVP
jgi:hypothetical protein